MKIRGEMILQRGAMHSWFNAGKETCRMLFVMLASEKVVTSEGEVLEEFFPKPPGAPEGK